MDRKDFIGGSDIAVVMGLSRWKSPLQLWAEKTGMVEPDDLSDNEAVEMGTELEDTVARVFTKRTGLEVRKAPKYYQHKDYPHFRCQVDRLVTGTDELLECKTAGAWKAKEWEGEEIPQEYICQVMWQLGITGRSKGWIAVLIGGQRFRFKNIDFDPEFFEKLVAQACSFWKMVQENTPPEAVGIDNPTVLKLNPYHDDKIQIVQDLNDTIRYLQETKMHIDDLEAEKKALEAKIKQCIGGNLGISTGDYVVTWKHQMSRRVDSTALKADGLYDRYSKASETRVLRVKNERNGS